ncbi:cupredoxin domain-containing protein [Alicyclobacillus fastidiosus]|uniref:cupredoxin domain-containing protein n=1 Tax=Alicyclobacillus fastidiosus TaxID=392011 RepID=UPI0034D42A6B
MKRIGVFFATLFLMFQSSAYVHAAPRTIAQNVQVTDNGISPERITVNQNDVIKITVVNKGTKRHNLVIPNYYIFTENLNPGGTSTAQFTANNRGNFLYYSDTPKRGTPEPGTEGVLIVN